MSHQATIPPEWTSWTEKQVLSALSRDQWRTFKEIVAAMGPKRAAWMNGVVVRGIVRRLVYQGSVAERVRKNPSQGRGPDEFRRVR